MIVGRSPLDETASATPSFATYGKLEPKPTIMRQYFAAAIFATAAATIAIGPAGAVQRIAGAASATQRAEVPADPETEAPQTPDSRAGNGGSNAQTGGTTDSGKSGVITPPSASDDDDDDDE